MTKIIAFVNQKGGVGKTTSALNLSAYLAALGKSTLLIDLDPQANATKGLGFEPASFEKTLFDVLTSHAYLEDVIRNTHLFGCELAPSSFKLERTQQKLNKIPKKEFKLKEALQTIKQDYNFLIIDCPPTLGFLTILGLVASDELIIPIQCQYFALESLGQLLKTVNLIGEKFNKKLKIMGGVLTMYERWNKLSRSITKEVIRHFPGYVFEAIVPRCTKIAEAPSYGQTILEYAPNSKGAKAYRQLAQEIIDLK